MNIKDYKNFIESFNFEGLVNYLDFESYYNDLPLKYQNPQHFKTRFSSIYQENSYLLAFIRKKRDYLADILDLENYKTATTQRQTQNQSSDTLQETTGQSQSQSQNRASTKTTDSNSALMSEQLPEFIYNNLSFNDGTTSLNNNDLNTLKNNVKNLLESSSEAVTSNKIQQIVAQLNELDIDNLKDKYLQKFAGLFSHFGPFNFETSKLSPLSLELEDHKQEILQVFRGELSQWEAQRQTWTQELQTLRDDLIASTPGVIINFLKNFNYGDLIAQEVNNSVSVKIGENENALKRDEFEALRSQDRQSITADILNDLNPLKSEINEINQKVQTLETNTQQINQDLNPLKSDLNNIKEKTLQITQEIQTKSEELKQELTETAQRIKNQTTDSLARVERDLTDLITKTGDVVYNNATANLGNLSARIEAIAKGQDFKIVWNLPRIDWESVTVETFGNNNEDFRLFFLPDESDRLAYLSYLKTAAPFTEVKNFIEKVADKLSSWNLTTRRTIYFTNSVYAGGGVLYNEAQGIFLNPRSKYGNITNVKKSLYSFFIVWEATNPVESNKFATIQRAIVVQD